MQLYKQLYVLTLSSILIDFQLCLVFPGIQITSSSNKLRQKANNAHNANRDPISASELSSKLVSSIFIVLFLSHTLAEGLKYLHSIAIFVKILI